MVRTLASWAGAFGRPLPAFAAASLFAVSVGAVVCALSGVPAGLWSRNVAAWLAGLLAAAALSRWAGARIFPAVVVLAPLGLAASLLNRGQDSVHRWLDLGPLHVNAAMLLLPAFVVALTVVAQRVAWWWIAAVIAEVVLVAQPDASQATAFAVAASVALFRTQTPAAAARWGIALALLALAAVSWMRPDPLAPVAEVEGVIGLADRLSPVLAGLSMLAMAAVAVLPALVLRSGAVQAVRPVAHSLTALLAVWCLAPALGAFPVPFVGVGLSPILGAWLGVGLVAGLALRAG